MYGQLAKMSTCGTEAKAELEGAGLQKDKAPDQDVATASDERWQPRTRQQEISGGHGGELCASKAIELAPVLFWLDCFPSWLTEVRLGFLGVAAAPACFSRSTTMEGSEEHVEKYPTEPVDGAYRASL